MEPIKISNNNFEEEVLKADMPVLIDFYADWCGPCKAMSPIVDEVANELAGKVKVGKVNVDESQELATQYDVMNIPTLIVFENGQVKNRTVGLTSKSELMELI